MKPTFFVSVTQNTAWTFLIAFIGYALVIFVNGAIPGFTLPTVGQALWISGFADSLAQGDYFSLRATHFGAPHAVSIAFGLPSALLTSLFLRLGFHATDAYSLAFSVWYLAAFIGAARLLMNFGVLRNAAYLAATLWLILPVVWKHSGYSALSLSIALLPLYFLSAIRVVDDRSFQNIFWFVICCILSLFMDGYGFIFFFCCTMLYSSVQAIYTKALRLKEGFILFSGFLVAYLCFSLYLGKGSFGSSPLDFFRGWGLDISFALLPTRGLFVFPDLLSFSIERSSRDYFGDASVYLTSYSIYLLLPGLILFLTPFGDRRIKTAFFIVAVAGFYMALGPSFKWFSFRPEGVGSLMPSELAIGPTGTGIISKYIPGFNNLRASYRWIAMALLGSWLLCIYTLSSDRLPRSIAWIFTIICILIIFPHPISNWNTYTNNRNSVHQMDRELKPLNSLLKEGEKVAFIPTGNDFLINYLAPLLKIRAYNVGGDKNLNIARRYWPSSLLTMDENMSDRVFAYHVFKLLENGDADAIAVSKIDLLQGAHKWPTKIRLSDNLSKNIKYLERFNAFKVIDDKYFQIIRLNKDAASGFTQNLDCHVSGTCIKNRFFTEKARTQTGEIKDGLIYTNGGKGFLHFGPYEPLRAGKYKLTLYGQSDRIEDGFFDVISENATIHFKKNFTDITSNAESELYSGFVDIENDVNRLEIRVFVNSNEVLVFGGYELVVVD